MSAKKRKTHGRKRRFDDSDDSNDSDSMTTIRSSPKKKRRRTLQLSQSDEESTTKKTKKKRKSSKTAKNRTPKPLKLTEVKATKKRIPQPMHTNNLSSPSPPSQLSQQRIVTAMKKQNKENTPKNGHSKKKKPTNDIRNFFSQCSAADYFSQFDSKPNYKNLKKQTAIVNKHKNKNKIKNESIDSEMKSIETNIDNTQNKPLQRPKPSPNHKNVSDKFMKLSCATKPEIIENNDTEMPESNGHKNHKKTDKISSKDNTNTKESNPPKNRQKKAKIPTETRKRKLDNSNTNESNPHKKTAKNPSETRKRKLDKISDTNTNTEANNESNPAKKKKYYPGFRRTDAPPNAGNTEIPKGEPYCLSGMRFVITGQLPSLTRDECKDLICEYGGRVTGGISGMTRYLISGTDAGESKTRKAKEKKVTILGEKEFLDLLRTLPRGKAPKLPKRAAKSKGQNSIAAIAAKRGKRGGNNNELFVEKYRPLSSRDLIGNNKCVKQLKEFLQNWDAIKLKGIRGRAGVKKGVLLSGQPGIGKTSAINVIGKELGFDIIEFNASDTRSKKSLKNTIEQSLNNGRMTDFFGLKSNKATKNAKKAKKTKNLIIMDEVDGMSSGDRGGMQELISFLDRTRIPIVCICNDRSSPKMRTLRTYCLDLSFRKPTAQQISARLYQIAIAEGFKCDLNAIQRLANGCNGDIRQMLHLLQFWSTKSDKNLTFAAVKNNLETAQKDLTMGPWDVAPKLFHSNLSLLKGIEYYFVDYSLMPLMIYENYLNLQSRNGRKYSQKQLRHLSLASATISDGDMIDRNIRKSQQYSALPYHGILSTVKVGKYLGYGECGRIAQRIGFPQWLGKNSKRKKNDRLLSELSVNMHTSNDVIALDLLPVLKDKVCAPLRSEGHSAIESVVAFMKAYNISRNDWDTIDDLQSGLTKKQKSKVATKVKTAFTKKCNIELNAKNVSKGKKGSIADLKMKNANDVNEENEASVESESEEDSNDVAKDNLIKVKKGRAKRGKKTAKKKKAKKANNKSKTTKRKRTRKKQLD